MLLNLSVCGNLLQQGMCCSFQCRDRALDLNNRQKEIYVCIPTFVDCSPWSLGPTSLADYFCSRKSTQWRFFILLRTNIRERKTGRGQKASSPVYSESTKQAPAPPASRASQDSGSSQDLGANTLACTGNLYLSPNKEQWKNDITMDFI